MARKHALKDKEEKKFDFDDMFHGDMYGEETVLEIMGSMLQASNDQTMMAIELTKLIVTNDPSKNTEEQVLSVFKNATAVIAENFALKNIMEQMGQ